LQHFDTDVEAPYADTDQLDALIEQPVDAMDAGRIIENTNDFDFGAEPCISIADDNIEATMRAEQTVEGADSTIHQQQQQQQHVFYVCSVPLGLCSVPLGCCSVPFSLLPLNFMFFCQISIAMLF